MKYRFIVFAFIILQGVNALSQGFENYKKFQQEKFEKFKAESDDAFQLFVQKRNDAFANYLANSWIIFNTYQGEKRPEMPKPDIIPVAHERPDNMRPERIIPIPAKIGGSEKLTAPELVRIPKSKYGINSKEYNSSFKFFGQEVGLYIDPVLIAIQPIEIKMTTISNVWKEVSNADYAGLINQLQMYKDRYNLNDWGYFKLCDAVANDLSKHDENFKRSVIWALMNLSGYKVKIGIADRCSYLMISSLQKMFSTFTMSIQGENYYILDFKGGKMFSYEQEFPGAVNSLDLNISKPLNLAGNIIETNLPGNHFSEWDIEVNRNVIDFYSDYPLVDLSVYFNAPMNPTTMNSLASKLNPQLEGKTEREKVDFLLHFVQNAFQYKTDKEQFGHEKFFFPDELIFYPYSDCEDRSILFSYLVKWFLNYDVIGVNYTLHIATAVALPGSISGDYLVFNGKSYTICDPTFINASIGMSMPQFKGARPTLIPVTNFSFREESVSKALSQLVIVN